MYILGLNAYHPDSSAALIKDGEVVAAVEEERFNRIKHWSGFPKKSISFCLNREGIDINDLEFITINSNPFSNFFNKIYYLSTNSFSYSFLKNQIKRRSKRNNILNDLP